MKIERCCVCDGPTGRCGEDSIFLPSVDPNGNDLGPLCEECCDAALARIEALVELVNDMHGGNGRSKDGKNWYERRDELLAACERRKS